MLVDATFHNLEVTELTSVGAEMEQLGYDALWMSEINHDPFLPIGAIAQATRGVTLGTAIAVAFARNPASLAYIGRDLQVVSGGRFVLGLGTQVKAHVTRRFSMPWSRPVARMREMVMAIHAIWDAFESGDRPIFEGEFYQHTLLTPEFIPPHSDLPRPPIYLGALGERMTELAGEVAEGIFLHPFTSERFIREVTLPRIDAGLQKAGKDRDSFVVVGSPFVITGTTEAEFQESREVIRRRVAWYGSTPAYLPVLALHGWSELGTELHRLSRSGERDFVSSMVSLVDDEVLSTFAVVAEPGDVARSIHSRFDGAFDRIRLNYLRLTDDQVRGLVAALRA